MNACDSPGSQQALVFAVKQLRYWLINSGNDPDIALADAIFYTHHPELTGHKIKPSETRLREEWNAIFKSLHWEEDAPAICVDK